MNIEILCVGKIKEKFYREAISEYSKRLSRYCHLSITEVQDEKTPENAPPALEDKIRSIEGKRLLSHLNDKNYIIVLAINGKKLDSVHLAAEINNLAIKGKSRITFIIGGSLGLSDEVIKKAEMSLSFSDMTFPHQLMRVILLEQIYRSYRIINHEPYHK
jgi:23S rRNA (pseudouridine1915-N3)-methyltransferase